MKRKASYVTKQPECIFVVTWDDKYRIYVREGQANNWFCEKMKEGKRVKIKKYVPLDGTEIT